MGGLPQLGIASLSDARGLSQHGRASLYHGPRRGKCLTGAKGNNRQLLCGRRYLEPQPGHPQKGGQVVLLGALVREATEENPVDSVSVMKNPMLGRRSLAFPTVP